MTKEEIFAKHKTDALYIHELAAIYPAMDEWASVQNKVFIDALQKIQDKIRIWEQDNGSSNLSARIKEIAAPALASYAEQAPQEPDPKQTIQEFYSQWCKDTKRSGGVLIGSSIKELLSDFAVKMKPKGQVTGKSAGELLQKVKAALCKQLLSENPDQKKVIIGRQPFTGRQLHDEIINGTKIGTDSVCKVISLALDIMLRKESGEAGKQPEQQPDERKREIPTDILDKVPKSQVTGKSAGKADWFVNTIHPEDETRVFLWFPDNGNMNIGYYSEDDQCWHWQEYGEYVQQSDLRKDRVFYWTYPLGEAGKQPEQQPADLKKLVEHAVKCFQSHVSDHTYTNLDHETYDGLEASDFIAQNWDSWISEFLPRKK